MTRPPPPHGHTFRMLSRGGSCMMRPAPIAGTPPYLPRILTMEVRMCGEVWVVVQVRGERS